MKKRKIDDDRFIININNKYYVVNEYTFDIINSYYTTTDFSKAAKELHMSRFNLNRELKKLKKEIEEIEYYDNNVNLDFPLKVQWKITNKCNLKCKHCYLGRLDNKELSEKELKKITSSLINSNVMEVTVTGGEALLVSSLPKIVALLIQNDIKVNIFTNALLLDTFEKKLVKILGYLPVEKLDFFISIDGMEKDHDIIRGNGSFKKTIQNIKLIVSKGYRVTTNSVLSVLNYQELPQLYGLLCRIGVYKIQISNLIDSGNGTSSMKLTQKQHDYFMDNLKKEVKKIDKGQRLLYADMPDENCNSKVYLLDNGEKEFLQTEHWKCSAGIGKCTIDYNGDVYCCPFIKSYCLGNVLKQDFNTIWLSKKRYEFLKLIAKENNNSRVCIAAKQRVENHL